MQNFKYIFFIIVMTATLGQFFSDLYLPSLSAISKSLGSTIGLTQLTITLYMLGYSFSSLIYGPLSDTIGRKKPLIIGLIFCLAGSLICSIAPNIHILILGRLLQGLGGGVGLSVTQAIVRDCTKGTSLAKFNSYLAMANISVIISAPILGGYIQDFLDWRGNFHFLLIYSIIVALLVMLFVPETKAIKHRTKFQFKKYRNNILLLLKSKKFLCSQICLFSLYAGIMAWLAEGPILLIKYLKFTPSEFGWTCCLCGTAYVTSAFFNAKLVSKYGIIFMLTLSKLILISASIIMLILALFSYFNYYVIVFPVMLFMIGGALFFPNVYAAALNKFGRIAGFASSLLVASQIFGGFISSLIIASFPSRTQLTLSLMLLASSLIIVITMKILIKKT